MSESNIPTIQYRRGTLDDIPLIARMNAQLNIEQESRNTMGLPELEARLLEWLSTDRSVVLLLRDDEVIGYLLYKPTREEYYPYGPCIYVRQFFIERRMRRRGIGKIAFELIVKEYFEPGIAIILEVLESNPEAKAFWENLGFSIFYTTLRRETSPDAT